LYAKLVLGPGKGPGPTTEREKTMSTTYTAATTPLDEIEIDYTGHLGPVATALVYDNDDLCQSPFYAHVTLMNDCESDWHDESCECIAEDTLKRQAFENFTYRRFTIVEESDD